VSVSVCTIGTGTDGSPFVTVTSCPVLTVRSPEYSKPLMRIAAAGADAAGGGAAGAEATPKATSRVDRQTAAAAKREVS
jgi:hypothetical protein